MPSSPKGCPPGKIVNPKTGRCIKSPETKKREKELKKTVIDMKKYVKKAEEICKIAKDKTEGKRVQKSFKELDSEHEKYYNKWLKTLKRRKILLRQLNK